jgi:tRNA threonylcarbamoyladenosine biosynthesis protein TsaE
MSISPGKTIISRGPEDTWRVAAELVGIIEERAAGTEVRAVLALYGELGSGKTCFVQGLASALGIEQAVTSPTFTIINEYKKGKHPLYHVDLYRLNKPEEAGSIGLEDYFESNGITAIEWAERAGNLIPPHAIHIRFETTRTTDERKIKIEIPAIQ